MRELILLRHAHAEPIASGQSDGERPLSDEGRTEAEAAGRWLAAQALVPDRVLCSTAQRTRETLSSVLASFADPSAVDQRFDENIYDASAGTLAEILDGHRDAERLLLVGHNPGLEHLAALMHSGQSGDFRGMPPGGVAVLRLPADAAIEPGIATLSAFWWP